MLVSQCLCSFFFSSPLLSLSLFFSLIYFKLFEALNETFFVFVTRLNHVDPRGKEGIAIEHTKGVSTIGFPPPPPTIGLSAF